MGLFDYYELRARIIPAAIIASPLVLPPLAFGFAAPSGWMWTTLASTLLLLLVYIFSHVVAYVGRTSEKALWESWGGSPSFTVLKDVDETFPPITKANIRRAVRDLYDIDLDGYSADAANWQEQATEAFRLVRQYLRQNDSNGIWSVHNAEYGALRNLMAATWLGVGIAVVAAVLCLLSWSQSKEPLAAGLAGLALTLGIVAAVLRFKVLPKVLRSVAFRYAESAWLCFLSATKTLNKSAKRDAEP